MKNQYCATLSPQDALSFSPISNRYFNSDRNTFKSFASAVQPSAQEQKSQQLQMLVEKLAQQLSKDPTEDTYRSLINQLVAQKLIKEKTAKLWFIFFDNYLIQCTQKNTQPFPVSYVLDVFTTLFFSVLREFIDPYEFPSFHQKQLSPIDYYQFGIKLMAGVIDFKNSFLGNVKILDQIEEQIKRGENVVLLANHQSEADPAIISCLFTHSNPYLAEKLIMVAGDRVVTDPMCKPFARGRDLFCVHSKKHMYDDPSTAEQKQAMNKRTVMVMQRKLNEGGIFMWIAPSGGRDRPDQKKRYVPDKWDPSSTGLIYQLVSRAKKQGHVYPFAMYCASLMPPPDKVEQAIGEARTTQFSPAGLCVGEEIDLVEIFSSLDAKDKEGRQNKLNQMGFDLMLKEWKDLESVIVQPDRILEYPKFEQPWFKE